MRTAFEKLHIEHLWVVVPHSVHYDLAERITVTGLAEALEIASALGKSGP